GGFGSGEPCLGGGVEVADREVDVEAERERPVDAAVRRDHGRAVGQRRQHVYPRLATGDDDHCAVLHALPLAGITQIRFAGRRRVSRPLSPVLPELPVSLSRDRSAPEGGVAGRSLLHCAAVRSSDRSPSDVMKTYTAKPGEIQRDWYVVDAE